MRKSTFKPTPNRDFNPQKLSFKNIVQNLETNASLINEHLEHEIRTRRPFKVKDPNWWEHVKTVWVLAYQINGEWEFERCGGNFFEAIRPLPLWIKAVHVFRSDGLHIRHYSRVWNYFKIEPFSITTFSRKDLFSIWENLNRPIRQKI